MRTPLAVALDLRRNWEELAELGLGDGPLAVEIRRDLEHVEGRLGNDQLALLEEYVRRRRLKSAGKDPRG